MKYARSAAKIEEDRRREKLAFTVHEKTCGKCGETKSVDDFSSAARTIDNLRPDCNVCSSIKLNAYRESVVQYHRIHHSEKPRTHLITSARTRSKKRLYAFDLDDHVAQIKERVLQKRCEISGVELRFDSERSPYSVSLDRIDNSKGYTYDNIRIVAWGINRAIAEWGEENVLPLMRAWADART